MLPQRNRFMVCESGLGFLLKSGHCDEIVVPVWKNGLLKDVIPTRGWPSNVRLLPEATQDGPVATIKRAAYWAREGQLLVAYGDNYYSGEEPEVPKTASNRACVRQGLRHTEQLDACVSRPAGPHWAHRDSLERERLIGHLAGWMLLDVACVLSYSGNDVLVMLNTFKALPEVYGSSYDWSDLGTPESYRRHLCGQ
jgi:hypothetical protein